MSQTNNELNSTDQPLEPTVDAPIKDETPKELTPQEKKVAKRQLQNYYLEQIDALKLPVELAELKCRHSKATYDNYRYGIELNNLQNGFNNEPAPVAPVEETLKPGTFAKLVDQDDLDQNPDMVAAGLKIGDQIFITPTIKDTIDETDVVTDSTGAKVISMNQKQENDLYEGEGND